MAKLGVVAPMVPIVLGGQERHLRFDLQAIALVRDELGLDLINNPQALQTFPVERLGDIIWAALTHEDESLDVDGEARKAAIRKVRRWIGMDNLEDVARAMFAAFGESMPEVEPGDPLPVSQESA